MVFPVWSKVASIGLAALGTAVAACVTSGRPGGRDFWGRLREACPDGAQDCSCADETKGWVSGKPRRLDEDRVLIGSAPVNLRHSMVSVRQWDVIETYLPHQQFFFQFSTAVPVERSSFDLSIRILVGHILHYFGDYVCVNTMTGEDPTVYVLGGTDRSGSDAFNQTLSEDRARVVAKGILELLSWNRTKLPQPVKIVYTGVGERLAKDADEPDGTQNDRFRQVKVGVSNTGPPHFGDGAVWHELGGVQPGRS